MSQSLADCWPKLERAKEHVEALEAEVGGWINHIKEHGTKMDVRYEYNSQENCFIVWCRGAPEPPIRWGLILGDIINNFHNALDYLAWILVQRGSCPKPKNLTQVYFPIYTVCKNFNDMIGLRLPGVDSKYLAVIKKFQPYHRGNDAHLDPLATLQELSRKNKHQKIQPTVFPIIDGVARIIDVRHFTLTRAVGPLHSAPIRPQSETELVRFYGIPSGTGYPEMDVKYQLTFAVQLENGLPIGDALNAIGGTILAILSEIEPLV